MTGWSPDSNYTLSLHPAADGTVQYRLDNVALTAGCEIKITDDHGNWYPNTGGNYTVAATGTYNVLFRPNANGGSEWFENYFKLESVTNSYTITWK